MSWSTGITLKVHYAISGKTFSSEKKDLLWLIFVRLNKQTLYRLFCHENKQAQHNFILFYFDYIWRTLPPFQASNGVLGTLFSSENSLFIQLWNRHFWVYIITLKIE